MMYEYDDDFRIHLLQSAENMVVLLFVKIHHEKLDFSFAENSDTFKLTKKFTLSCVENSFIQLKSLLVSYPASLRMYIFCFM